MVAPFTSQGSNSEKRRAPESLRRRREFPRKLSNRRHLANTVSTNSPRNPSKARELDESSNRPPQSPHTEAIQADVSPVRDAVQKRSSHGSIPQEKSPMITFHDPSQRIANSGRPPIAPGVTKRMSLSRSGSVTSRSNSKLSKSSASPQKVQPTTDPLEYRQDGSISGRQTFYVRARLEYLTGIRTEELKRRTNAAKGIVVGYAALAKSGKRIALSQPLGPNLTNNSEKPLKIHWTNPKGLDGPSSQALRRSLHFSLKLEKEADKESRAEDDSMHSGMEYNPEVVKVIVGLKCGEEKYPLGIANLVINGKDAMDQRVDLSIRPTSDLSPVELKDQPKPRLGLFGKKSQGISFKKHDQQYRLASNACLRVRMDVKSGPPGESKGTIWGDADDGSHITNISFDTKTSFDPAGAMQQASHAELRGSDIFRHPSDRQINNRFPPSEPRTDPKEPISNRSGDMPPMEYLLVGTSSRTDEKSAVSSLTVPFPGLCSWICLPFCGEENESTPKEKGESKESFSLEGDLPSLDDEGNRDGDHQSHTTRSSEYSRSEGKTDDYDGMESTDFRRKNRIATR